MASVRKEGDKREVVWNWGSHVDRMIHEAQQRGDFDNLPGAGKPLDLDDNVYAGEMASAYRVAKNANAAPLWVQLDKEIGEDKAALEAFLERNGQYIASMQGPAPERARERERLRARYMRKADELNKKIGEYNIARPRQLTWLEKVGVNASVAARTFDERIPPATA